MTPKILKIVLIGYGNVGRHLTRRLLDEKAGLIQILVNKPLDEKEKQNLGTLAIINSWKNLNLQADLYLFCIPESALKNIPDNLKLNEKLVAHCSGSTPSSALEKISPNTAVIYPLYSFSKKAKIDFNKIPLLIEANSAKNLKLIRAVACRISPKVFTVGFEERKRLHLGAVIANNFSNYLYALAHDFLKESKPNHFHLLLPIIRQTAKNIKNTPPLLSQTGPARRGDLEIIHTHLEMLKDLPDHQKIYKMLSNLIYKKFHEGKL